MNFGLAAGAEAVPRSARFGAKAHDLDKRRTRCDRKQRDAAADEIDQGYECAFKGKRSRVVHAAREFNSAEQPLTSSLIPA